MCHNRMNVQVTGALEDVYDVMMHEAVREVMDRIVIVGSSLGGWISVRMAKEMPHRVQVSSYVVYDKPRYPGSTHRMPAAHYSGLWAATSAQGLCLINPAIDITEVLWNDADVQAREAAKKTGEIVIASPYAPDRVGYRWVYRPIRWKNTPCVAWQ